MSLRVAMPFARSVAELALEAALLVGWPIGWALGMVRVVERGEHRVFETLGERPARSILRLVPQGVVFAGVLAGISIAGGQDASAPGRVINQLLEQARASCEGSQPPVERAIPFADVAWLCAKDQAPRLVGRGPGALAAVVFTAKSAQVAGDLGRIDLSDAHLALGSTQVRAGALTIRGLAPWAHASNVAPLLRAALLVGTALAAAHLSAWLVLRRFVRRRFAAIVVGGAGPLAALGTMRVLERIGASPSWSVLVLPLAIAATLSSGTLFASLPRRGVTASK